MGAVSSISDAVSDTAHNAVGSVDDLIKHPAATVSGTAKKVAAVIDNPIVNPANFIASKTVTKTTGISAGDQLLIGAAGGAVGWGLGVGTATTMPVSAPVMSKIAEQGPPAGLADIVGGPALPPVGDIIPYKVPGFSDAVVKDVSGRLLKAGDGALTNVLSPPHSPTNVSALPMPDQGPLQTAQPTNKNMPLLVGGGILGLLLLLKLGAM